MVNLGAIRSRVWQKAKPEPEIAPDTEETPEGAVVDQITVEQDQPQAPAKAKPGSHSSLTSASALSAVVLVGLSVLILYPLVVVAFRSLVVSSPRANVLEFGLGHWTALFSDERLMGALQNTISLSVARQSVGLAVGLFIAWLIARTDIPYRGRLAFGFWLALFLPPLTGTLGWVLLLDPESGLAGSALAVLPFDIYSWWGIVFAHLMTGTLAINVTLLAVAFRSVNPAFEETSLALGANPVTTFFSVVMPAMFPAIVAATLLGLIRSLDAFEIELVLGSAANVDVFSTIIYKDIANGAGLSGAAAVATLMVALVAPLMYFQQRSATKHEAPGEFGAAEPRNEALGVWQWPAFAFVALVLFGMIGAPTLAVVAATFTDSSANGGWGLTAWTDALADVQFLQAGINSISIGLGAAVVSASLFTLVAYMIARPHGPGMGFLSSLTRVPSAVPGIVLSLGFLLLFTQLGYVGGGKEVPMWVLVLVVSLSGITLGVQLIRSSLAQLGGELEEASWASGANNWETFKEILYPLISPAVLVVAVLAFTLALRAIGPVVLLADGMMRPLSLLQLDQMAQGQLESAAVAGVVLTILIGSGAVAARAFGLKLGFSEDA